jgi:hypothetical protein
MDSRKIALVVSGMHRSGTSSVTGTFALLGATPPKNMMPAYPENPRGYFESERIMRFNDRILAESGSSWSDWRTLENSWRTNPRFAEYLAEAKAIVDEEYSSSALVLLKDPRFARILPFWRLVLEDLDYRCLHVIPIRDPGEVAASLHKRSGMGRATATMLWLRHMIDAEEFTRQQPRIFFNWTDFLADWETQTSRMSALFGFSWPRLTDLVRAEIGEFLAAELRHHRESEKPGGSGTSSTHGNAHVPRALEALTQLIEDPQSVRGMTKFDTLRKELRRTESLYGPIYAEYELAAGRLNDKLSGISGELDQSKARSGALQLQLNEASARSEQSHAQVTSLGSQLEAAARDLESQLQAATREREAGAQRLAAISAELERSRQDAAARSSELERLLRAAVDARAAGQEKLIELTGALGVAGTQAEKLRNRIDETQTQLAAVSRQREIAESDNEQLRRQLTDARGLALADLLRLEGVEFLNGAYHALLRREVDGSGKQFYLGRLQSGISKIQVLEELYASEEARIAGGGLRGLEAAIRRHRLSRVPIVGGALRMMFTSTRKN